jgi:hypothetical protein
MDSAETSIIDVSNSDTTTRSEQGGEDKTVGIIICVIIALIIILVVFIALYTDKQPAVKQSGGTNKLLNKPISTPKPIEEKKATVAPRPRVPDLINTVMRTRRMNTPYYNPFHNNHVAVHILNALQTANRMGDLNDRRLPYVIDLAVVMPANNNAFTDMKLQEILIESANQTRDKLIGRNRAIARAQPTPAARMDKYIQLSTTNTSDDQNSHDTYVNKCLRNIIAILRDDQKEEPLISIFQIRSEIQRKYNVDPPKETETLDTPAEQSVLTVIDTMYNKGASKYNSTLEITESELLQRVWMRSLDKRNEAVKEQMQDMIYSALASSYEGGSIVCINGRCAKLLSAIVVLDFDPRTHELRTLEQFRNELFIKTRELVKNRANKALTSSDPKVVAVATSYLAEKQEDLPKELDPEANKNFTIYLRQQIEAMVKEHAKNLPPDTIKHIISDCVAAV